jgi:hypothetical protein
MSTATSWFDVDKQGLSKLMEGRSKSFVLYELLQNAWDQNVTEVMVTISPVPNTSYTTIEVEDDDPEGFTDLTHAYTLFADSSKKSDPERRGRFNLGEKLVIALAREATIETTKGCVTFNATGRHIERHRRESGSVVHVEIPMTRKEHCELMEATRKVIAPPTIKTLINNAELPRRKLVAEVSVNLPTVIGDDHGVLRHRIRMTVIRIYEPLEGEVATLYEMGIPVVETGDRYHVDVHQKVPLNSDRDNVTPSYLKAVRVAVLNATFRSITAEETTQTWVREACGDPFTSPEAIKTVVETRFGADAVAYDPSDPEANKISTSEGRQVVHGGSLSGEEWARAREAGVLPAAGKVTPSPKPYAPGGKPLTLVNPMGWTHGMSRIAGFAQDIARELLGRSRLTVQIANEPDWVAATFGHGAPLVLNLPRLGDAFFHSGITDDVIDLIIHEFGHHYSVDHLSSAYHDALTKLGAQMTRLALTKPELFQ